MFVTCQHVIYEHMFTYIFTFCSGLLFFLRLLFGCKMKNDGDITELHIPASFTEQELGRTAPPSGSRHIQALLCEHYDKLLKL